MQIEYDFEASVGYWVHIAAMAFRKALNEELAPMGLTSQQMQVLAWLALDKELSQSELASRMDIEPPTLAGILERMEAAGWVLRTSCSQDRRKKLVRMDAAALPIWEEVARCAREVRAEAVEGLSEEEVEQLRSSLRIVHENLSRRSAPVR